MKNELHEEVFKFCEAYRTKHPEFRYWLRSKNSRERLDNGFWFQGTEKYAFVGLYDRNSGNLSTKSIGLVFFPGKTGIEFEVQNVFKSEQDPAVLALYEEIRKLMGEFKKKSDTIYIFTLKGKTGFEAATYFLDNFKPQIDKLILEKELDSMFISKEEFQQKLNKTNQYRGDHQIDFKKKCIIINLSWNSNNWQGESTDPSGHKWVSQGNIPHESWNFDFDNPRNTDTHIKGFAQFTHAPKLDGDQNLVVCYSQNQIVGFYGKCTIEKTPININENQSYNLLAEKSFTILLNKKISNIKEKGYLEDKERVGQIGFSYLENKETIRSIIGEAILLNPESEKQLMSLIEWFDQGKKPEINYWVFQGNPTLFNVVEALKNNVLKHWAVKQYEKEIKIGDKVILWISGQNSGIYALATVTSPVHLTTENESEIVYYTDPSKATSSDRVCISIDVNLVNRPLLKDLILRNKDLEDLNQGRQGTNFKATKQQYDTIIKLIHMKDDKEFPLNQIFYGPPGTGKTYNTVNKAVRIVDQEYYTEHKNNRDKLQERFNELIIKDWEEPRGQIAFTTFHQSFSYEDFVEGIKPLKPEENDTFLRYKVEQGIFQSICKMAEASINARQISEENIIAFTEYEFRNAIFYKISLGNSLLEEDKSIYEYCVNNNVISIGFAEGIDFSGLNEEEVYDAVENAGLNRVEAEFINRFKTAPKIGNYVLVSNGNNYIRAFAKITGEYQYNPDTEIKFDHFRKVEWIFKDVLIPVSEFYQKKLSQQTIYKLNSEYIIPSFFIKKATPAEGKKKNYVLIIDEINRGNVSSIFGELITLIEAKKRAGQPEALQVVLPYSKTPFKVPDNVYILGTMNTADRSIEALDTALRRRFSFEHMEPKPSIIKDYGKSKGQIEDVDVCLLLDKINERIEKLIDKDHRIGHSYFMDAVSIDDLKLVFNDAILPLLQEYFFGDNGKIGLVLGNSFIEKVKDDNFDFASFADYDGTVTDDLKRRSIFTIKPESDWNFSSIYEV